MISANNNDNEFYIKFIGERIIAHKATAPMNIGHMKIGPADHHPHHTPLTQDITNTRFTRFLLISFEIILLICALIYDLILKHSEPLYKN